MAEAGRIWELSDYEKQRQPHPIITDDTPIAVPPSALQNELLCPICLDILNQTMTTKACLHRFCRECIMTAMRNGNKECPTCRKKLQSKRDLHPDATFDALIAKLFPNRAITSGNMPDPDVPSTSAASSGEPRISIDVSRSLLRKQEEKMAKQNAGTAAGKSMQTASASATNGSDQTGDSVNAGAASHAAKNGTKKTATPTTSATNEDDDDESESDDDDDDVEVELLLKPLVKPTGSSSNSAASQVNQETRCLKTTPKATIAHIAKYLALRRQVEADHCTETQVSDDEADGAACQYEIFAKAREVARFVPLEPTSTLRRTADLYALPPTNNANSTADANEPIKLVLYYKLRREPASANTHSDSTPPKRAKNDS